MKKIRLLRLLLLVSGIVSFIYGNAQQLSKNTGIVNVGDYGLDSNDATGAIRRAIDACKISGCTKIILPKGVYHLHPLKAVEKYYAIANNDNGLKRIAFYIKDLDNLEIDGQGSSLVFHGKLVPFIIDHCTHISVSNLVIDWDRPFHSEGEVVAVDTVNKTFDLRMTPQFPYEIQGNELVYKGEGWEQGLQENIFFDPLTRRVAYDDTRYVMDPWSPKLNYRYGAREIAKGIVRIVDTIGTALPKPGWIFVSKGRREPNRTIPGFVVQRSFDVSFSDISLYHAGSMGFIAEKSGNISLDHITVTTPPHSGRYLSLGSDATHFVNCKGFISIRNSLFENMHDDAVNIQGVYALFDSRLAKNKIAILFKHYQQFGFSFAAPGDSIRLVDRETLLPYRTAVVNAVRQINEEYTELSFTEDIGDNIREKTALENISWYTDSVLIEGCTVRDNRARSILVSTPGKVVIRKNFLSSEMAGIAIGGEANYWAESGPVNDVLIEGNTFKDCCTSELNQSVIQIVPSIRKLVDTAFYHRNIHIINNRIETFDRRILTARSVNGIWFNNNSIVQTQTFRPFYPGKPTIELVNCSQVRVVGNNFSTKPVAGVTADTTSKKGMVIQKNIGLVVN